MDEHPDRGINESDRIPDLEKGTTRRSSTEKFSPEDVRGSENDPFLPLPSQRRTPDGFPRLSRNDRNREPRSNLASNVWNQGFSIWRALDIRSTGNGKVSDSAALIKEPGHPPTDRDAAESSPAYSRDQLHRSRILSFLESNSTSAPSSGVDRPAPDSSVTALDEFPNHRNKPLRPSLKNLMETLAPDVGARDQSLERQAQKRRAKSPGGKEYVSLLGADAMPLHAGRAGSTTTSHLEIEDDLRGLPVTGNPKPADFTTPEYSDRASPRPGRGTGPPILRLGQDPPYKPAYPSRVQKHAKAASHPSESQSVAPITPTRDNRSRHLKSLSAEAEAFHPSPPFNYPTTPTRSYGKGHGKGHKGSVNIRSRHYNSSYVRPPEQSSTGTPSVPVESGAFKGPSVVHSDYPKPHQHTPEGQGQSFRRQGPMPLPLPTQIYGPLGPNMSPFPSPMHPFNCTPIHYSTQVYKQGEPNPEFSHPNHFDSYAASQVANATPNAADLHHNGNIYTQDTNSYGPRYYSNHADPSHQVHFYPVGTDYAELIKN